MSGVLSFEISMILITVVLWFLLKKKGDKHITKKLILLFIGVLLFEIMSEPMWRNLRLDPWAYLFNDVSWIITLGWVNIFVVAMLIVDKFWNNLSEGKKFWLYLLFITLITTPAEILILQAGIRAYDPVLTDTMLGIMIFGTKGPIEIIFIVPIIAALIIAFYKFFDDLFKSSG